MAALFCALPISPAGATGFWGRVTNDDGSAPVQGAAVEVVNPSGDNILFTAAADASGNYVFSSLPPGTYHVQAVQAGYFSSVRSSYTVASGQDIVLDFALQPTGLEAFRDTFTANTWASTYGATRLSSNGNVLRFGTISTGGGSYNGITKAASADISVYPYLSIRNRYAVNSGALGNVNFIFDFSGGWNNRISTVDNPAQNSPWQDRTYAVQNTMTTAFLLQGDGAGDADQYLDHMIIHSADRGYVAGSVKSPAGTPIPGTRVRLLKGTAVIGEALSDASGNYNIWAATGAAVYSVHSSTINGAEFSQPAVSIAGRTLTTVSVVLDTSPVTDVSGARFAAVSSVTASLAWDGGTRDYWVAFSSFSDFSVWVASAALPAAQNTTTYYGLSSNATYYFRIKHAEQDDTHYSLPVSSATPPDYPRDAAITDLGISSVTLAWGGGTNAVGTLYLPEISVDESFSMGDIYSGAALSAIFGSLNADSTYFMRVRTYGEGGQDSQSSPVLSTVTLANAPGSEAYALVSSTGMSVFWDGNGNPGWTKYELTVSTEAGFASVNYSAALPANYYEAPGLVPNTTYYFKARAVNGSGIRTAYTVFGATMTYAAAPAGTSPALDGITPTSMETHWLGNDNPGSTEYYVQASTAANFTGLDYGPGTWAAGTSRGVSALDSGLLYHFRVRARDALGRPSPWLQLGSAATPAGADTTPPSVTDLQGGDDAWRGAASGAYRVHFSDLGTGLDKFQVKVTTGPAFSGTLVSDWTDAVTGINSDAYASDWALPAAVFEAITENVTSYVSVRVYDLAAPANFTVKADAFYVLRDTTPPTITNNAVSPAGWLAADPGAVFDVDFADALAGLAAASYSAGSAPGLAGGDILGWTAVPGFAPGAAHTALWGVAFGSLRDGGTNYISVRAVDAAGNQRVLADVFRILKNTVGPAVSIAVPASAYVSTVTLVAGAAAPMTETDPVAGVEVSLQELSSPNSYYFDGADFASPAAVWLAAGGTLSWAYDASTAPFAAGVQYRAAARARDSDGLLTAPPYPNASFRLDQIKPTIHLSTPVADSSVYAFDAIEGTAADTGGAGLGAVEIYVRRVLDGKWWNFVSGAWGDVAVASAATAGASWSYGPGPGLRGALAHDQQYFIAAAARDAAAPANSSGPDLAGSTITWKDTLAPEAVAAFAPSTGSAPGRVDLRWTFAGDDGGALALTYGRFAVQYSTFAGAVYSTQTAQVMISTAMVPAGAQLSHTVAGLAPETTYYLRMWVQDDAEFWSAPSPLASTLSGDRLNDTISGSVRTPAGTGVTGVMVDAITNLGAVAASAYTLDDGLGSFSLTPLPDGIYRVRATWLQDGFSNSIAKDQIPMGYADTNFVLSLDYELASVSGSLPASSPSGLRPSAAGGQAQLWRGARLLAAAAADSAGRFVINNLIPGPYTLRVSADGTSWKTLEITLAPGQELRLQPLGALADKAGTYVYPNPASSQVSFRVATAIYPVRIKLSVFSLDGTLVQTSEYGEAGWSYTDAATDVYTYRWDFSGSRPASGVYFCTVKLKDELGGGAETLTRKFAVIR